MKLVGGEYSGLEVCHANWDTSESKKGVVLKIILDNRYKLDWPRSIGTHKYTTLDIIQESLLIVRGSNINYGCILKFYWWHDMCGICLQILLLKLVHASEPPREYVKTQDTESHLQVFWFS